MNPLFDILLAFGGPTNVALPPPPPTLPVYETTFDVAELPISEHGRWSHLAGAWLRVQTTLGRAQGERDNISYNDAYALLSGFPANQRATAVVRKGPQAPNCSPEVELLLRWTDTATSVRGYEVNLNPFQIQIMRLDGDMGDFHPIGGGNVVVKDGDEFRAEIVGSTIKAYVAGNLVAMATDSNIAAGQPGIGFFRRQCGTSADLTFDSYRAEGL